MTVGFVLLTAGHAPESLTILILAMLPGLGSVLIISHWWKISIHAAVASGATEVLVTVFGPAGVTLGAVVLLTANWARVALGVPIPRRRSWPARFSAGALPPLCLFRCTNAAE